MLLGVTLCSFGSVFFRSAQYHAHTRAYTRIHAHRHAPQGPSRNRAGTTYTPASRLEEPRAVTGLPFTDRRTVVYRLENQRIVGTIKSQQQRHGFRHHGIAVSVQGLSDAESWRIQHR